MSVHRNDITAAPSPVLSRGVIHGDRVYLSGVTARDMSGDIGAQTREALETIDARLAAMGTNRYWVLTAHVWLRDMSLFQEMNSAWNDWVDAAAPPSRACVSGEPVHPQALVEIVVTAVLPEAGQESVPVERYGLIQGPGRPSICLGLAYRDWFTVCMTAPDHSADIGGQTRQILGSFDDYLAEAGTDKMRLLTADIWLKQAIDFDAMNVAWNSWIDPGCPPVRACVRADMARRESLIEIRITATR